MSHLNLDGDSLARLLARAGVDTVAVGSSGATVTAPGWEAHIERIDLSGEVRLGALALRITGVALGAAGLSVKFSIAGTSKNSG